MVYLLWLELAKQTATMRGGGWKPVRCEHCGADWAYHFTAHSSGRALDLSNAQRMAHNNLARGFARGANVSCPRCGCYQRDMVERIRAEQTSGLGVLTMVALIAGPSLGLLGAGAGMALQLSVALIALLALGPTLAGAAIAVAAGRAKQRQRAAIDPNRDAASRIGKPRGAAHVMTREQHEQLAADAAANGTQPPPPIAWPGGPRLLVAPPPVDTGEIGRG